MRSREQWTAQRFDPLAGQSTSMLADLGEIEIPALDAQLPPGWVESVDGRGLFVRVVDGRDPGAARPDAWFIHGLAGSSTNWISLAGILDRQARCYLVDLPGHGRSDPPPRNSYRLADMADVVAALIRQRSTGPIHLVGHSLGAMVAVHLASRHPGLIADLTLISPAVPDRRLVRDRGADARLGLILLPGIGSRMRRRLGGINPVDRARGMAAVSFADPARITEKQIQAAAADMAWRIGLPWAHDGLLGSFRALVSSYLRPGTASFAAMAARVRVPTLVTWGTRDRLVDPRLASRVAASFGDARLLVLPGIGHAGNMEDPLSVGRAITALWAEHRVPAEHQVPADAASRPATSAPDHDLAG